ncbi:hypothetical protein CFIMG_007912RA00001 [Ceratocystis fimbriata CBS 114723]|uniref:Uncharacterized protein n=1 Tax=Ceratocystis fimbriata CBS 114723 TaxID=1035309 RepID=A0A2C5X3Q7_9PEZI|nr:hypothetical protein CFIMG_007912RA00001 [Ceratocystis fimbriata CBS 114723]
MFLSATTAILWPRPSRPWSAFPKFVPAARDGTTSSAWLETSSANLPLPANLSPRTSTCCPACVEAKSVVSPRLVLRKRKSHRSSQRPRSPRCGVRSYAARLSLLRPQMEMLRRRLWRPRVAMAGTMKMTMTRKTSTWTSKGSLRLAESFSSYFFLFSKKEGNEEVASAGSTTFLLAPFLQTMSSSKVRGSLPLSWDLFLLLSLSVMAWRFWDLVSVILITIILSNYLQLVVQCFQDKAKQHT